MFSALFGKEWRQLRTLRWGGLVIGLLLPWLLLLGADAAQRGWIPAYRVNSYSFGRLLTEAAPLFFIALWTLLALMLAAQAFSGDRTDGTERFLLERPVPRRTVWGARLAASAATLLMLLAIHAAYLWLLVDRVGVGSPLAPVAQLVSLTMAAVACAYVGGMIAASAVGSLQATLLGIGFAAVPGALGLVLSGLFPHAHYRSMSAGIMATALFPLGYVVASYLMHCRGEPEGRGRLRRGIAALAVTSLFVPIAFVSAAPLAMRLEAGRFEGGPQISSPPAGGALVVTGKKAESGWIVDVSSGEKRRFLPQGIQQAIWNADGTRVAVFHYSGALGSLAPLHLDVFDNAGRRIWKSPGGNIAFIMNTIWADGYVLSRTATDRWSHEIVIADVDNRVIRTLSVDVAINEATLLGPTDDGSVYLFQAGIDGNRLRSRIQRLDLETASLAEIVLDEEAVVPPSEHSVGVFIHRQNRQALSPSGRYLKRQAGFVDLTTGLDLEGGLALTSVWLTGDRYARVIDDVYQKRLVLGRPGRTAVELGRFDDEVVLLFPSPDRRHLMVQVWSGAEGRMLEAGFFTFAQAQRRPLDGRLIDLWIVEAESGERIDRADWLEQLDTDWPLNLGWAGPSTLALLDDDSVSIRNLEPEAELRKLIGG